MPKRHKATFSLMLTVRRRFFISECLRLAARRDRKVSPKRRGERIGRRSLDYRPVNRCAHHLLTAPKCLSEIVSVGSKLLRSGPSKGTRRNSAGVSDWQSGPALGRSRIVISFWASVESRMHTRCNPVSLQHVQDGSDAEKLRKGRAAKWKVAGTGLVESRWTKAQNSFLSAWLWPSTLLKSV